MNAHDNIENLVDHEVRLRTLEKIAENIDRRFDQLNQKIDSHFIWMVGLIFVSIILPVSLHSLKLV